MIMQKSRVDYHIHTYISSDSDLNPIELVKSAINHGYQEIAFTDHLDLNPVDIKEFGKNNFKHFLDDYEKLNIKYGSEISIKKGIEIGEIHRFYDNLHNVLNVHINNFDLIIGSIHRTSKDINTSISVENQFSDEDIMDYYVENLKMVKFGKFHILGHLGIFERYYNKPVDKKKFLPIIDEIFENIIKKDIALEINLSGLQKNINSIIPTKDIVKRYKEKGGRLISIGSDSHTVKSFENSVKFYDEVFNYLFIQNDFTLFE